MHPALGPLLGSKTGSVSGPGFGPAWSFVARPGYIRGRDGKTYHHGAAQHGPPVTAVRLGVLVAPRHACLGWRCNELAPPGTLGYQAVRWRLTRAKSYPVAASTNTC